LLSSLWFNYNFFIVAPLLTPFATKRNLFFYGERVVVNFYFLKKDEETNFIFSPIYYEDEE